MGGRHCLPGRLQDTLRRRPSTTTRVSNFSGSLNNNAGTVNIGLPGAGSGTTLNIGGNYTQSSSGTLDIKIFSVGSYDNMAVSGAATLSGKVDVFVAAGLPAERHGLSKSSRRAASPGH